MPRLLRLAFAIVALACAAGCTSFVRLAYDNADVALRYMADDYLDLDGVQAEAVRERIARVHAWHRADEVPRYAAMLDSATVRIRKGLQAADVAWAVDTVQARYRALLSQAIDEAAPLAGRLTAANLERMQRRLEESNRKFERDNAVRDPEAHRAERMRVLVKRAGEWLGEVTPDQEARIAKYVMASPRVYAHLLDERRRRQAAVLAALRDAPAGTDPTGRLKSLLVHYEQHRAPDYAASAADWQGRLAELLVDLGQSLTEAQRRHLLERLAHYRREIDRIAGRTLDTTAAAR